MKWISVEERLPENDRNVLLFTPEVAAGDPEVWPGWREGGVWRDATGTELNDHEVTHWREIPVGPDDDQEELPNGDRDRIAFAAEHVEMVTKTPNGWRLKLRGFEMPVYGGTIEEALDSGATLLHKFGAQPARR